ncbi:MAG: hypothetical protein KGZ60_02745 [Truepera sp.]|nr:hypothetical protein [Truepera sp.]
MKIVLPGGIAKMRFHPLLASLLIAVLMATGCLPAPADNALPTAYAWPNTPIVLSERLALTAYPGTGLLKLCDQGSRVTAWFVSYADALTLYHYFAAQLVTAGWQALTFNHQGVSEVRASYRRGDERLWLKLVLERPDGRFRLELR